MWGRCSLSGGPASLGGAETLSLLPASYDSNGASKDEIKERFAQTMEFVEEYLRDVVCQRFPFSDKEKNKLTFEVTRRADLVSRRLLPVFLRGGEETVQISPTVLGFCHRKGSARFCSRIKWVPAPGRLWPCSPGKCAGDRGVRGRGDLRTRYMTLLKTTERSTVLGLPWGPPSPPPDVTRVPVGSACLSVRRLAFEEVCL